MTQISTSKLITYAVEIVEPSVNTSKVVTYGVEIIPDVLGNARQSDTSKRPIYKVGPKPYINFPAGKELFVTMVDPVEYTIFRLLSDGVTIVETTTTLTPTQPNVLLTNDFNQIYIARTSILNPILKKAIQLTLRYRAL